MDYSDCEDAIILPQKNKVDYLYALTVDLIGEDYLSRNSSSFQIRNFSETLLVRPEENLIIVHDFERLFSAFLLKRIYEAETGEEWAVYNSLEAKCWTRKISLTKK